MEVSLQLSHNMIYGFLLRICKCTYNVNRHISPCRCLLTLLYPGWNIKMQASQIIFPQHVQFDIITPVILRQTWRNFMRRSSHATHSVSKRPQPAQVLQIHKALQKHLVRVHGGFVFLRYSIRSEEVRFVIHRI